MRRLIFSFTSIVLSGWIAGCSASGTRTPIQVTITDVFANSTVQAGDPPVTLQVVVQNDNSNKGVRWSLSVANVACSPGCGTLVPGPAPSFSAVYTPPTVAPVNQQATITAISVADSNRTFAFIFTIEALTAVKITNKFDSTVAG